MLYKYRDGGSAACIVWWSVCVCVCVRNVYMGCLLSFLWWVVQSESESESESWELRSRVLFVLICSFVVVVVLFVPSLRHVIERDTRTYTTSRRQYYLLVSCVCVCVCIVKLSAIQMPTLTHSNSTHPTVNNCNPNPKHMSNSKFLNTGKTGSIRELAYCPNVRPTRTPGRLVIQKYE